MEVISIKKAKVYTCKICGQEVSLRAFGTHVKKHKMTSAEYWKIYPYLYPEPQGIYGIDYVTCPICKNNRTFQFLWQHLKSAHQLTIEEFIIEYPDSLLQTSKYREIQAERCRKGLMKSWSDFEYRKNKSEYLKKNPHLKPMTEEQRQHQKEVASQRLKDLWKDPEYRKSKSDQAVKQHCEGHLTESIISGYHKSWIKYTSRLGQLCTLKSSWELKLAEFLDHHDYDYQYEKKFDYYDTSRSRVRKYYADFYLSQYNLVIEVKPQWALDHTNVRDKLKGVIDAGTKFMFFTEREMGSLVSKEEFEKLIQSNINE